MANPRNQNDPYRSADDPYRSNLSDDEIKRQARLDGELQPDPELAEGPASGGKVAMFAIAIALVLGAVFYGMNNSSINQAGTSSTAQNAQNTPQASPPPAPSGMRDVTPRAIPIGEPPPVLLRHARRRRRLRPPIRRPTTRPPSNGPG